MSEDRTHDERATDKGWLCLVALRCSQFWDWIDKRRVDQHALSLGIFYGTIKLTSWAMGYAALESDKTGLEVAAVIGAVTAPYMALQAAAIGFYFRGRP